MAEQRRTYSGVEKAKIIREGLSGTRPISEVCRHYGITATQYYDWQRRALAGMADALEHKARNGKQDKTAWALSKAEERIAKMHRVITEITLENLEDPGPIILDTQGSVWIGEVNRIARITNDNYSEYPIPSGGYPDGIILDSNGAVLFTLARSNSFGALLPSLVFKEYKLPVRLFPTVITKGSNGSIWLGGFGGLLEWSTDSKSKYFALPGRETPVTLAPGPGGSIYFATGDNKVKRFANGKVTQIEITNTSEITALASDVDGDIWFSDFGRRKVGEIKPGQSATEFPWRTLAPPTNLVVGTDGVVWFVEPQAGVLANISSKGRLNEFSLNVQLSDIALDRNNTVWLTAEQDSIVRISPNLEVSAYRTFAHLPCAR